MKIREQQSYITLNSKITINTTNQESSSSGILKIAPGPKSIGTRSRQKSMVSNLLTNQDTFKTAGKDFTEDSRQTSQDAMARKDSNQLLTQMVSTQSIRPKESFNINKELSLVDEREGLDSAFKTTPTREKEDTELQKDTKPNAPSSGFKDLIPHNILR